jgi:D-glycero-alpha-D-manno-heptose-7-phosphate kinase
VCSIAIEPRAVVQIEVRNREEVNGAAITVRLDNYGEMWDADEPWFVTNHPFIAEAINRNASEESAYHISIHSDMPAGASTGTSAAVLVALIAALAEAENYPLLPQALAMMAHDIETSLDYESGVQDQAAAAHGGVQIITINYPEYKANPIAISPATLYELEERLVLAYLGTPHASSAIHKEVIGELGVNAADNRYINELRILAMNAAGALKDGDLKRYGAMMNENTIMQRCIHYGLICPKADQIIDIADRYRAAGCKVNGAGGDGGTVTILCNGDRPSKQLTIKALHDEGFVTVPVRIAREGLRVWRSDA